MTSRLPFGKKSHSSVPTDYPIDDVDHVESTKPGDHLERRENWGKQIEFFLSCVGYAVGLGNIWRFPYLCMQNGGGAFLIPYFSFLLICGMPIFFLELVMGQYSGASPISMWNVFPVFKGLGWAMITVSGIMCIYYNIIIGWVVYYLGSSFTWNLPWRDCGHSWNTEYCYSYFQQTNTSNISSLSSNVSLLNMTDRYRSSAEEFWLFNTLEISTGIHNLNGINWKLFGCFMVAWVMVYGCLFRGIKSSGKVVYLTATVPYVFLTIILIRGVTLPGSMLGIRYYIVPRWELLLNFKIWATGAMQIFYSLGPAWGGLITMSSYNRFHNNCLRDAILVPTITCLTSFYGGFAIFSVIGNLAHRSGEKLDKVIQSGPGLAFVAYPEALAQLPGGCIWAIFFFLMLITVGLDSQFATFETMISGLTDEFPRLLKKRKYAFTLAMCVMEMIIGLPLVTRAGVYVFQILDWYSAAFSVLCIGLLEVVVLIYGYGVRRIFANIEEMLGPLHTGWKIWWGTNWCFLAPVSMIMVIIISTIQFDAPKFDKTYIYPDWAIAAGWCVGMMSLLPIPVIAIYQIIIKRHDLRALIRPNDAWVRSTRRRSMKPSDFDHSDEHEKFPMPEIQ